MFIISSIAPPSGYTSFIFGGVPPNIRSHQPGEMLGPEGAVYFIAIPGLGSLILEDVGSTPSGWGVTVNGSTLWTYGNAGPGALAIAIDGSFTLSGGNAPVSSSLVTNISDSGLLLQRMYAMAMGTPALRASWQNDPMNTLYGLGFPRTCMNNMDENCCAQLIAFLRTLPLSRPALAEDTAGDFACTACRIGTGVFVAAGFVAALTGIQLIIEVTGGLAGPAVASLATAAFVAALAVATGLSSMIVAEHVAAAWLAGPGEFLSSLTYRLCHARDIC